MGGRGGRAVVPTSVPAPSRGSRSATLDGVRGLAVIVLLLYHFGVSALQGAWVGLSLFFVFSGYVIVTIMLKEHAETGRVDFVAFYLRRARRLLPALFALIVVVSTWALLWADDDARRQMRGDVLATAGFVMNWRLVAEGDRYFADLLDPSYFRHAWTLSVEEQFYVLAPFVVVVLVRRVADRRLRVGIVVALALASAVWTAVLGVGMAAHVYYGTDTRVQSLLAGMAVAFALGPDRAGRRPAPMRPSIASFWAWTATLGSIVLFFVVAPMSVVMFEYGGLLVVSMVTAVGLAGAVAVGDGWYRRIFASPVLVYLGMLTYGLYLWHWPVTLWLAEYAPQWGTPTRILVGSAITIAVASASFHLLEVPIMARGLSEVVGGRVAAVGVVLASLAVVLLAAFAVGRVPADPAERPAAPGVPTPTLVPGTDAYLPGNRTIDVDVVGDSTAASLADGFAADSYPDLAVTSYAAPGCDLVPWRFADVERIRQQVRTDCDRARADFDDRLAADPPEVVVLSSATLLGLDRIDPQGHRRTIADPVYQGEIERQLDRFASRVRAAGVERLVVLTVPCRGGDLDDLVFAFDGGRAGLEEFGSDPVRLGRFLDPVEVNDVLTDALPVLGQGRRRRERHLRFQAGHQRGRGCRGRPDRIQERQTERFLHAGPADDQRIRRGRDETDRR